MVNYFKSFFLIFLIGFIREGKCSDSSIATWAGFSPSFHYPYYSIYNGTDWSTPLTIGNPGDFETISDVYTALNSMNGQTMAVWTSYPDNYPMYAIFSNGTWSTPAFISNVITTSSVYVSFDPVHKIFLATWPPQSTAGPPYYSVYSNGTWSLPATISSSGGGSINNVTSSFNPNIGAIIVTWQDVSAPQPFYAIYSGTMGIGSAIETSVSSESNIFSTFDTSTNTTIATWIGHSSSNGYYSAYSNSWSSPGSIPTTGEFAGDITCSYNSQLNQVIATWLDGIHGHHVPLFSTYNGSSWTPYQEISSSLLASINIFTSFNDTIQKTIAVMSTGDVSPQPVYSIYNGTSWSDLAYISNDPTYASYSLIYIGPIQLSNLNPPSNLSGNRKKNNFGILYEYYDTLNWSLSNSNNVIAYNIYANGVQIGQVGASTNQYQNHNVLSSLSITYTVTAIDSSGNESSSITITL